MFLIFLYISRIFKLNLKKIVSLLLLAFAWIFTHVLYICMYMLETIKVNIFIFLIQKKKIERLNLLNYLNDIKVLRMIYAIILLNIFFFNTITFLKLLIFKHTIDFFYFLI